MTKQSTTPSSQHILVYRDILLPASEGFIPRHYNAFSQLTPLYIGSHVTRSFAQLQKNYILTGETKFTRTLYKQWGHTSAAAIKPYQPKLIHAHFGRGGALALPLAKKLTIPLVVTFHGGDVMKNKHYAPSRFYNIYPRRLSALKTYGTAFLCVSEFLKTQLIKRGFPKNKVHTHYIGMDLPESRPELKGKSLRNNLLFVGRLVEKKGLDTLFHALHIVQENHPTISLDIIGEGPLEATLRELAKTLQLSNINFLGWKSPEHVAHAMEQHLALCTPSQQAPNGDCEGLPTVIMEAQLHGAPVIATHHAGIPEIITHNKTGLLSDERNPQQLAQNIISLLNMTEENYNIVQHTALNTLYAQFNAATQSKKLEILLNKIIEKHE